MAQSLRPNEDQRWTDLVSGIIQDSQKLIREEIALARAELQEQWIKVKAAGVALCTASFILALGGILASFGVVFLVQAVTGMALWLDFIVVSFFFFVVGGLLFYLAREKVREVDLVPRQTVASVKESVQLIREA